MNQKNKEYIIVHKERGSQVRLNKFISETGYCSRREADKLIEDGRVTIDGIKAVMGMRVNLDANVKVDGKSLKKEEKLVYIALNKPVGL